LFNANFFKLVQLLRGKYHTDSQFNLFSVLRSDSDEVRLHSRFLAEILNPKGSHGFGGNFLDEFVKLVGAERKSFDNAIVITEYKNIDILIRGGGVAIIIENKIYAADQDNQLTRYYKSIRGEGIEEIYLVYLTLDGSQPSSQSTRELDKCFLDSNKFQCLSYRDHIHGWTNSCLSLSAKEPALRESFAQYLELIEKLTAKVKSPKYMNELKQLLNKDDNLANCLDLQQAYNSILVDLQVDLWERIQKSVEPFLGKPCEKSIVSEEKKIDSIRNFMDGRRNSSYFGLFYPLGDGSHQLAIEMQGNGIIAGISCSWEAEPTRYNELVSLLENHSDSQRSKWWPCYRYIEPHVHYKSLTRDNLSTLTSEKSRQEIADKISSYLDSIRKAIGDGK
jgi:hypothetical protein